MKMNKNGIALALTTPQTMATGHIFGHVINIDSVGFHIKLDDDTVIIARKAFSCTYEPITQDFVELTVCNDSSYFLLNILQRNSSSPATLSSPYGIDIKSPKIALQSNALDIISQNMSVDAAQFDQTSQSIRLNTDSAHFSSRTMESSIDRLIQRVKDSFKIIERIEQVSAVDIIQNIKNAFIQRSRQVDITAKSDVKINGERIHMG